LDLAWWPARFLPAWNRADFAQQGRLRHEVERKNRQAILINSFVENTDRLLGTTLAGSTLCSVLIAVRRRAGDALVW